MLETGLVKLKDSYWLERQQIAGKAVAKVLSTLHKLTNECTPNLNLLDLQAEADKIIKNYNCIPTFQGYKGFPGVLCLSVNNELVHGIPRDYILQDGDVVKFDVGATFKGAIADAATTTIYGKPKSPDHVDLIKTCKEALKKGIAAISINKQIGVIGYAIDRYVKKTRFGLITKYGGHGISENEPHAWPFIANRSLPTEGIRIQPGFTFAIEPMCVINSTQTSLSKDGWTVTTPNIGVHEEHTIFVAKDKIHIITEWQ